jgi:hypothetical protein
MQIPRKATLGIRARSAALRTTRSVHPGKELRVETDVVGRNPAAFALAAIHCVGYKMAQGEHFSITLAATQEFLHGETLNGPHG